MPDIKLSDIARVAGVDPARLHNAVQRARGDAAAPPAAPRGAGSGRHRVYTVAAALQTGLYAQLLDWGLPPARARQVALFARRRMDDVDGYIRQQARMLAKNSAAKQDAAFHEDPAADFRLWATAGGRFVAAHRRPAEAAWDGLDWYVDGLTRADPPAEPLGLLRLNVSRLEAGLRAHAGPDA